MEEEKKKTTFLFVFLTYIPIFLLKFRSGDLIGCGIKFRIQRVPTRHTFDGPCYPNNKKYLKKWNDDIIISFFQVFLVFGVAGPVKSMPSGYSLDAKYKQKNSFFFSSSKINKYYFIILTIILLVHFRRPILS